MKKVSEKNSLQYIMLVDIILDESSELIYSLYRSASWMILLVPHSKQAIRQFLLLLIDHLNRVLLPSLLFLIKIFPLFHETCLIRRIACFHIRENTKIIISEFLLKQYHHHLSVLLLEVSRAT